MYYLLGDHIQPVLNMIGKERPRHVPEYDWLIENLSKSMIPEYQARYRRFWNMNRFLSKEYFSAYFERLNTLSEIPLDAAMLAKDLYDVPTNSKGRQTIQFSYATKLLHMKHQTLPIYDSFVCKFYFWEVGDNQTVEQKIQELAGFHAFLVKEYARVISQGLLERPIEAFRKRFEPRFFTDQKTIDSLIWAYTRLLAKGGLIDGQVTYK